MNTCLNENDRSGRRGGFTVVEILVAITVIAILSAMLIPVVGSAMRRASEFAIESEMAQLDLAIEHFKSDNGFYPPSFARLSGGSDFMPYLNRIAPNHGYSATNLNQWWTSVGSQIQNTPGSDLVFWLSGIAKNKQYPLGLAGSWIAGHGAANDGVERNAYFDFSTDRLNINGTAASFTQARGKPAPYQYIDAASYGPNAANQILPDFHGYHVIVEDGSGGYLRKFFNPNSFQLVANGLDGLPGGPPKNYSDREGKQFACTGLIATWNLVNSSPALNEVTQEVHNGSGLDNISNFVNETVGKVETVALDAN
ncbi:MAG: type II secretion system GspH family protein [Mariniblastus sp.]|nr:type II secretion system GspH family protein [Mariniblastus sp.]